MPGDFEIYRRLPGIVLGFHGCDESVGEDLLCGKTRHLSRSHNEYDWLGSGTYFWENDPKRALEFAQEAKDNPHLTSGVISKPFVVGAVIDLGLCLNLLDRMALEEIVGAYDLLKAIQAVAGLKMPENKGRDRGARFLDCAVIEALRGRMNAAKGKNRGQIPPYDTVRGAFWEGDELYPNAGIRKKSHIQIAVRNTACIKGYFRPIDS